MTDNPECPVEFDAELNEYHIVYGQKDYFMIYYCPFCGGKAPKSRRALLFHRIAEAELHRLCVLTKPLRTVKAVLGVFGKPDIKQPLGTVITTPERDGKPESSQSCPSMIYTKLSDTADIHVTIYPNDRVGFSFHGKPVKKDAS
jgi:hypothetical protein